MLTLIEGAEVYAPEPRGAASILLAGGMILTLGTVDRRALYGLGAPVTVIDAGGCVAVPGFIDPHEHLLGAGGEQGFASRMPEVTARQIAEAGITTVVGLLGTDSTSRPLAALLGKARQLEAEGLSAYMHTGGFRVPGPTLTGSPKDDLLFIDAVIGVGEVAIADDRSWDPTEHELARLVSEAMVGGSLTGKAGVVHFHVGPEPERLGILHRLLDRHAVAATSLYPTHCNRDDELLADAVALAKRGAFVDVDTTQPGLGATLRRYRALGGPPGRLTVSSDAHTPGGSPARLRDEVVAAVREHGLALEEVLPHVTANTARALKLARKGRLEPGMDGDIALLDAATLAVRHVLARGRPLVRDGRVIEGDGAPA